MGSQSRRTFIKLAGLVAVSPVLNVWSKSPSRQGIIVNDVHSQLNPTRVSKIIPVASLQEIQQVVLQSHKEGRGLSISGGRHAGGSQQFSTDNILIDIRNLNQVLKFDADSGLIEMQAGMVWTELLDYLQNAQTGRIAPWGIAQKQTGADQLSLAGTLSANAHGQGLQLKPFIADVESFVLVDAQGQVLRCSRSENAQLFSLVIGGYGLFGIIYSVTLRLVPRQKVEREVKMIEISELIPNVEKCVAAGYPYGDFQVNSDEKSDQFLRNGIFCSYRKVDNQSPLIASGKALTEDDWFNFVYGAHVNKHDTFESYVHYLQSTCGQINWSDVWQRGPYIPNYHQEIDRRLHSAHKATEVLTELYVPRAELASFMNCVRTDFLANDVNLIYSTIRFIGRDDESFLPWAKADYACVIFNLHTVHTKEGIEHSANAFRRLIDLAIRYGGSYYLTYHKYATREQVLSCYPQFTQFLELKHKYDPYERFTSDWYRHYKKMFSRLI